MDDRLSTVIVQQMGLCDYEPVWQAMKNYTRQRDANSYDQLWLLQHHPVFTLGQAGRFEHIVADTQSIPLIKIDRGGQVTYHGPGQLIVYFLLDLKRRSLGVKQLVTLIETSVLQTLHHYAVPAQTRIKAPGVYVSDRKIASLGLKVSRGCSYHGLALNIAMDLRPFECINPCGYPGLQMTQVSDWVPAVQYEQVVQHWLHSVCDLLKVTARSQ